MKRSQVPLRHIFAANVYWFRKRLDMSQEALGFASNVHRNHIGEIERAEVTTSLDVIERLTKPFGVLPFELLVERPDAMEAWEKAREEGVRKPRKQPSPSADETESDNTP